jgi:hypothetical protein
MPTTFCFLSSDAQNALESIQETVFRMIAEELVRAGTIDPAGSSAEQLRAAVAEHILREFQDAEVKFNVAIDHTDDLLKQAREFMGTSKHHLACLLYATYFEHEMNSIIIAGRQRRKVEADIAKQVIRDLRFEAKSTYALALLGLPSLETAKRQSMQSIINARNAFVHYKWQSHDIDSDPVDKQRAAMREVLANCESVVKYLAEYEDRVFFDGKKSAFSEGRRERASP